MTAVAVMQPYFFPYAGYYSLAKAVDVFVILDNVQFPRRGWVHRNRFRGRDGALRWLTLPLEKAPRDSRIDAMRLRTDAGDVLEQERARFPSLAALAPHDPLYDLAFRPSTERLVDVLEAQLRHAFGLLSIDVELVRASSIGAVADEKGESRILRLVEAMGGKRYVNLPGGRGLYDEDRFAARDIELRFLASFKGDPASALERFILEGPAAMRADVAAHVAESGL